MASLVRRIGGLKMPFNLTEVNSSICLGSTSTWAWWSSCLRTTILYEMTTKLWRLCWLKVKTDLEQHQTHIVSDNCHTYKCQKQWHLQFTRPWVRLLDDSFLCMAWVTICGQLCDVPVTFGGCHLKGKLDSYVHLHFIQNNVTSSSVNCIVNSYITWRPYAFQSDLFAP